MSVARAGNLRTPVRLAARRTLCENVLNLAHYRRGSCVPLFPRVADFVAKRFWVSEEATLVQDQPAIRKVDSKIRSFRFDCCAQAAPRRLLQQNRPEAAAPVCVRQGSPCTQPSTAETRC